MCRGSGKCAAMLALIALAACSDATGPRTTDKQVSVRLATVAPSGAGASLEAGTLVLVGSNGTLRIDELYMIMDEFELKRLDDDHCVEEDHSCERFRAGPALLDVPLDGSGVIAVAQAVDTGTYARLDFEIEDLDDVDEDEDDGVGRDEIIALRAAVRSRFPDWPRDASVLVVGSFTPTGGTSVPFRVFFDAEIEIEMHLDPPVVIEAGATNPTFTVRIDPGVLFRNGDGTVRNLALYDFALTGSVIEFEVEIENGISEIEYDD